MHCGPVNWGGHMQLYELPARTHWPLFLHGFGLHELGWSACATHVGPVNWGGQTQLNELPTGTHWPPLLHGFLAHGLVGCGISLIYIILVNLIKYK